MFARESACPVDQPEDRGRVEALLPRHSWHPAARGTELRLVRVIAQGSDSVREPDATKSGLHKAGLMRLNCPDRGAGAGVVFPRLCSSRQGAVRVSVGGGARFWYAAINLRKKLDYNILIVNN